MFERCPGCTSGYCAIPVDGPDDAEILCLGERPGQDEEKLARSVIDGYRQSGTEHYVLPDHMCFIGQAGREFNENYLQLAGLDRSRVRVGNIVRCGKEQNRKPTEEEVRRCTDWFLRSEVASHQYSVIVLMGSTAASLWPSLNLEVDHGIPQWMELSDSVLSSNTVLAGSSSDLTRTSDDSWSGYVVPMYHPAAGLHDTGMMIPMLEDWVKLGRWLESGEWQWPEDEYPNPDYRLCQSSQDVQRYFWDYEDMATFWSGSDTESDQGAPYSIQISIRPGTAIMCLLQDQEAIKEVAENLQGYELALHYAPADLGIFGRIAGALRFQDTMQAAYHFGNLPQGLKALSYRQFGVRMQSWEDLVTGPSREKLTDWLIQRVMDEKERPVVEFKQLKTKTKRIEKPNPIEKELNHLLKHIDSPTYDPWERLEKLGWDQRFQQSVGWPELYPRLSIKHASLEDQVRYACRDADLTLRHALKFQQMRQEIVAPGGEWFVHEGDWD